MRVSSFAVARPALYDRNAQSVINFYYAAVGPHAAVSRFSYTVAAGKKLNIEVQFARLSRTVAATVAGQYHAEMSISTGASTILTTSIHTTDNLTTGQVSAFGAPPITVYASESASGITYDTSTGGTVEYYVGHKATLFDA